MKSYQSHLKMEKTNRLVYLLFMTYVVIQLVFLECDAIQEVDKDPSKMTYNQLQTEKDHYFRKALTRLDKSSSHVEKVDGPKFYKFTKVYHEKLCNYHAKKAEKHVVKMFTISNEQVARGSPFCFVAEESKVIP